jgi:hypothetical protein
MAEKARPQIICIKPNSEDWKVLDKLHQTLGVDRSQIFRLAIRALAAKEGLAA